MLVINITHDACSLPRYFIIIDDLCEESDWEKVKGAFPNNNLGSRILITTRITSVAEACCSGSYDGLVHKMKPLNEIDSQRLLLSKAVGYEDGFLTDNMKLFCDETLRRCDGIPLFIIGMADWLIKEQLQQQQQQQVDEDDEHQRLAVCCEGQMPQLPEWLEQSLSSAFNDFPNNESRLLSLYMSMLPYGYKFDKDRLLWKWRCEVDVSWFEAEELFSQLVDRNVITCVAANYCKHNNVDEAEACQWKVNHFIQQFLASESADMGFIFTTTTLNLVAAATAAAGHGNETSSRLPRRLALHHTDPQLPSLLETIDLSQTRSLSVSRTVSRIPLDKFVNLVLLDLEGWENLKDEDLLLVCRSKMFFLRYLSVRNTRVSKLPNEIKELQILDTLDASYTQITELPLEVFELPFLGHLDLRGTRVNQLPKQIVGLQGNLESLLVGGQGTINSVETAATRVPHDVRHLDCLQTLATVDLTQQPANLVMVTALGGLRRLRVLAFTWSFHLSTDTDYCKALLSSIEKWKRLESLTIHCGLGCSMEFLGSLEKSSALRKLQKFKVTEGRFTSVPTWIRSLGLLTFVQITVCNKQTMTDDLKILGGLPKLQCLILGLDIIPEQAILINKQGFSKLERFLVNCPMPWLTFSTGAMPKLTYLQLKFCSTPMPNAKLKFGVPSGISNLHRLTEVALCYNAQYINSPIIKMTVEAVTRQVAEHSNPIDMFINGIEQDDVQEEADEVTENTIGSSSRTNAGAEDDAQAVGEEAKAVVQCDITKAES
jgi:Leucine-rich repeat (LRR) protein